MNVIALKGRSQSGKTLTLTILYDMLLKAKYEVVFNREISNGDFIAVLKYGERRIGIATQGDYPEKLQEYLAVLEKASCAISVCACRTRGKTKTAVTAFLHQFIKKTIIASKNKDDENRANLIDATFLFKKINPPDLIKGIEHFEFRPPSSKWRNVEGSDKSGSVSDDIKPSVIWRARNIELIKNAAGISPKKDPGGQVPLFFGTNRNITNSEDLNTRFGNDLDDLKTGTCMVSIPPGHIQGNIEKPRDWWIYKFPEDTAKHIVIEKISLLSDDEFTKQLALSVNNSKEKDALIFIHGYNTTFAEAAHRAAQVVWDLPFKNTAAFFSWPSTGGEIDYFRDDENSKASITYFEKFIEIFLLKTNVEKLHLIAHSMGGKVLSFCLDNLQRKQQIAGKLKIIDQIVFGAPDIGQDDFRLNVWPNIQALGKRRTLYASDKDKALQLSEALRRGLPRLGEAGPFLYVSESLDTIDASNVKSDFFGHSYIFDTKELLYDLAYLLDMGLDPETRKLRDREKNKMKYWLFPE